MCARTICNFFIVLDIPIWQRFDGEIKGNINWQITSRAVHLPYLCYHAEKAEYDEKFYMWFHYNNPLVLTKFIVYYLLLTIDILLIKRTHCLLNILNNLFGFYNIRWHSLTFNDIHSMTFIDITRMTSFDDTRWRCER